MLHYALARQALIFNLEKSEIRVCQSGRVWVESGVHVVLTRGAGRWEMIIYSGGDHTRRTTLWPAALQPLKHSDCLLSTPASPIPHFYYAFRFRTLHKLFYLQRLNEGLISHFLSNEFVLCLMFHVQYKFPTPYFFLDRYETSFETCKNKLSDVVKSLLE